jgi:DNA-binding CsgD family transcriptional regulator
MDGSVSKPVLNLGPAKPPAMIAARLQCRRLQPLFSEGQWLRIAASMEFTRRELEIVRLIFEDEQEQSIATALGISVNTVRTQLKRLYRKFGVTSRVGLVLQVVREHLADSQDAQPCRATVPPEVFSLCGSPPFARVRLSFGGNDQPNLTKTP